MHRDKAVAGTAEAGGWAKGAANPGVRLPDVAAMRRWLVSQAIVDEHGAVLSWANPRRQGYPYPEAAGLFLSWASAGMRIAPEHRPLADRVAAWLCRSVAPCGGVGRGDITYVFDSAVALAGLMRYRAAGGSLPVDESAHRLWEFIANQIASGAGVRPATAAADGRWSTQFGAHLLKCLHALQLYARAFDKPLPEDLAAALVNRSGQQPSPTYVHPLCYEQEGHLVVAHYGYGSLFEPVDGTLDWLAELQQPDGSVLAFANGMNGFGEPRSDATAQAARLWLVRDRTRYAEPIARAFAFLAASQAPQGGIRYAPQSDDVCSWSTMFALQAVEWFVGEPRLDDLL